MFRKISRDVKIAALNLHENGILGLPDILACVGFSESTFFWVLRLWRETGDVISHRQGNKIGHCRLLHFDDIQYLLRLVRHRPDWFLDELLNLLERNRFVSVHYTTIHRELERVGMSHKKLQIIAKERNEPLRNDYMRQMAQYSPDQLGFIDETSKNDKTPSRRYGRGRRGRRAQMKQKFVRGRRLSAEGLLTTEGIVASTVVEGSMKRDSFLQFLENHVVRPSLSLPWAFSNAKHFSASTLLSISWTLECPCNGQCTDSPWRRDCRASWPAWYAAAV